LEAVQDVIALHVAADIGSAIGDQLDMSDANDVTRQNLAPDPATGRARRFSTLGAAALVLPERKLFRYCVGRQLLDLCDGVVSRGDPVQDGDLAVAQFCQENQLADAAQQLGTTYRTASVPSPDAYVNPLFQRVTPAGRQYVRNADFPNRLLATRLQFRDHHQPTLVQHRR
jgi:hypothetical protein